MFTYSVYNFKDIYNIGTGLFNLSGNDHIIGKPEKRISGDARYNNKVLSVKLPYSLSNYCFFYNGPHKRAEKAVQAMCTLLNDTGNTLSEKAKSALYKTIIEALLIVHHVSTDKRNSKLNGINSLSTSCIDNCFCLDRIKNLESVCSHCYAETQQKQQLAMQDGNTLNGLILRNILIPSKYWKKYINPVNMTKFFRIESFGDVANKTQALNYIEFIKAFPAVHFAVWSKNFGLWYFAFSDAGKPKNLSFVVSSNKLNRPELYHCDTFGFIDHVFTVYDKKYIAENGIIINCGGRSCMQCIKKHRACYFTDTEKEISEELK